jgi:hypothetical protein
MLEPSTLDPDVAIVKTWDVHWYPLLATSSLFELWSSMDVMCSCGGCLNAHVAGLESATSTRLSECLHPRFMHSGTYRQTDH